MRMRLKQRNGWNVGEISLEMVDGLKDETGS